MLGQDDSVNRLDNLATPQRPTSRERGDRQTGFSLTGSGDKVSWSHAMPQCCSGPSSNPHGICTTDEERGLRPKTRGHRR